MINEDLINKKNLSIISKLKESKLKKKLFIPDHFVQYGDYDMFFNKWAFGIINFKINNNINFKINSNIFLFFFILFRYFIFNEIVNNFNFNNNFLWEKLLFNNNFNNYLRFYYLIFYLIVKIKYLYLLNILNSKYLINIKDMFLFYKIEFYKIKFNFNNFSFDFFFKLKKKLKVFFLSDFFLRVEVIYFLLFKRYIEYFRLFKYNEYINHHPNLYKYPLLKNLLRIIWKKNNNYLFLDVKILNFYKLYYVKMEYLNKFLILLIKNKNKKMYLNTFFLNKFIFLFFNKKLFFNKLLNIFYIIFKPYYIILLLLFVYNIHSIFKINNNIDLKKFKRLKSFGFLHLQWQLQRYIFNLYIWILKYILLYVNNIFLNNYISLLNFHNLNLILDKNINYLNACWYKITSLILIEYLHKLFLKFFRILENSKKKKFFNIKWKYTWIILKRWFVFESTKILLKNYNFNSLSSYFSEIKYNLDYIFWKIFFIGHNDIKVFYKFDINNLLKIIKLDYIIITQIENYNNFLIQFFFYLLKKDQLFKFIFFFIFLRDFFFKLISNLDINLYLKILYYLFNNYNILNLYKIFQRKIFIINFNKYNKINNWNKYYNCNKFLYKWMYEYYLKIIVFKICIIRFKINNI